MPQNITFLKIAMRGFAYHLKSNLLICVGCAAACMVLTGALLIGDSLDGSLRKLHDERLGNTRWTLTSNANFFRASLADSLNAQLPVNAAPILQLTGTLNAIGRSDRIERVNIIGANELFFRNAADIDVGDNFAIVNSALAQKLGLEIGSDIVIRFKTAGALPMDAPFGIGDNFETYRTTVTHIAESGNIGDFSLRAEHFTIYNVFVPLIFLQLANDLANTTQTVVINDAENVTVDMIHNAVERSLDLRDAGLNIRDIEDGTEIYSDRIFINNFWQSAIFDAIPSAIPVSAWFANSINNTKNGNATPYSFVATPPKSLDIDDDQIILNRWTADDLDANIGDSITLFFFVPQAISGLRIDSASFVVSKIIGNEDAPFDRSLMPPYPGLSGAESCNDWDPSIPVDLSRIRPKDEEYWELYEGTPKAIISFNRATQIWDNRFGVTTAIRIPQSDQKNVRETLAKTLTLSACNLQITDVRANINRAIDNGVDFAPLFLGLSFFTLAASLLFIWLMSALHVKTREKEQKTLNALGYSQKHIFLIYMTEGVFIFLVGTTIGTIAAPLYTLAILNALRSIWFAAAPLPHLQLSVNAATILIGGAASFACALISMYLPMRSISKKRAAQKNCAVSKKFNAKIDKTFTMPQLIKQNIMRQKRRAFFEIAILACALLILGITQLFHKTPQHDPYIRKSGTGGFYFYAETDFAIPHEKTTAVFLRERGLDIDDDDFISIPMRKLDGDDASCLNLNQTSTPPILSVNQNVLANIGAFNFASYINIINKSNPWKILGTFSGNENAIYGIADANTITWGLGKNIGDTLTYINEHGDTLAIILAASLENSILQGSVIIAEENFIKHFPSVGGYRAMLVGAPQNLTQEVAATLETYHKLHGLRLTTTIDRLNAFNAVENTYLSIFAVLGMFGLALGGASLYVVVAQDIEERKREFKTLAALGFNRETITKMVFIEHAIVAIIGIAIGLISAFIVTLIFTA